MLNILTSYLFPNNEVLNADVESLALKGTPPCDRKDKITKTAQYVISLNPQGAIRWKAFALTAAEFSSRFKSLTDGGLNFSEICDVWLSILFSWQKKQGFFFKEQLKSDHLNGVIGFLQDIKTLASPLQSQWTPIEQAVSLLQIHVKTKKGPTYIPLTYTGSKVQAGHAFILKVEKAQEMKDTLLLTLYNRGDGSQLHPIVDLTSNSRIPSIRYFPIAVPEAVFFGEEGKIALSHLVHYGRTPAPDTTSLYEGSEFYSLLQTLGQPVARFKNVEKKTYAKEQQITGSCAVAAIEHVMLDSLVDFGYSDHAISKIMLNMRLCFLIQAHLEYAKETSHSYYAFIQESAAVLGTELQSLQNQISQAEFIYLACTLIECSSVIPPSPPSLKISPPPQEPFPITVPSTLFKKTGDFYDPFIVDNSPVTLPKSPWPLPEFQPKRALAYFENATQTLKLLEGKEKNIYLEAVLTTLPLPIYGKEGPWEAIGDNEILPLLKQLKAFAEAGMLGALFEREKVENFCYLGILYCIADSLVRRKVPELVSFASSFLFLDKEPRDEPTTLIGSLNKSYSDVYRYFKASRTLQNGEQREVIFPVEPLIPIEEAFYLMKKGESSLCTAHLRFLSTFFSASPLTHSQDLFIKTWQGKGLPEEINLLYHFSFLTHYVYRLKLNYHQNELPSHLSFEEKIVNGTLYLMIQLPEKTAFLEDEMLRPTSFLFSKEIEKVDTNRAALAKKEDFDLQRLDLSEQQLSELLRIWNLSCSHLRFHQALQFMRNHKETVTLKFAQEIIKLSLLAPRALFEALHDTPEVEKTIRLSFYELIQFYTNRPAHKKTVYFLFNLLTLLEIQLHAGKASPPSREHLQFYIQFLKEEAASIEKSEHSTDDSKKGLNLVHSYLMHLLLNDKSPSDWALILHNGLILNEIGRSWNSLWSLGTSDLYTTIACLNQIYRGLLPSLLTNLTQEKRDQLCNQTASLYFGSLVNLEWQLDKNSFRSSEYVLDFYDLKLKDPSQNLFGKNPAFEVDKQCRKENVRLKGKWDLQKRVWVSNDGIVNYKLAKDVGAYTQFIKINFNGEERLMQNTKWILDFSDESDFSPLSYFNMDRLTRYEGWVLDDPKENDPALLICEFYTDQPLFAVYVDPQKPTQYSIKKITPEGFSTSYSIVNLGNEKCLQGLFLNLTLCLPPKNILCLIDETTGNVEEIKLLKQKIHFKKNTKGRLECVTPYPGFYLDEQFQLEELGSFNGALILKNAFGRKKVLIIPRRIQTGFQDKSHQIEFGHPLFEYAYFSFELSPYSNDLFATEPLAYLYLAYVMKAQKLYSKSLNYLKKVHFNHVMKEEPTDECPHTTSMTAFFNIKDGSLEAICINAHLASRYLEFIRSMDEHQFKEDQEKLDHKLIFKISENYLEYLRVGGGVHAFVPQEFRLSKEQEKTLLFFLEDYYLDRQEKFPLAFSDRLRLILEHYIEGTIQNHPIPYSIINFQKNFGLSTSFLPPSETLKNYDSKTYPLDPYPVRISGPQLVANFFTLYSLASQPKNPAFKYLLLALHHTNEKTNLDYTHQCLRFILTKIFLFKQSMKTGVTDKDSPEQKSEAIEKLYEYAKNLPDPKSPRDQTFSIDRFFTLHSPFENEQAQITLPSIQFVYDKEPLLHLATQYLPQTPQDKERLAPLPKIQLDSPLERSLDETLQKNQISPIAPPSKITLEDPSMLNTELLEQKKSNQKQIKMLQKQIHELFAPHLGLQTAPFDTDEEVQETLSHYLSRQRGSSAPFSPEKIMLEVVLKGNPALLLQTFPLMTVNHAAQIIQRVQHYFHLQAVDVLITTSLDTLKSAQKSPLDQELLQKLHGLLSFKFLYNPALHPEISLLVTKTRLLPREQQIKIHLWLCEQIKKEGSSLFQGGAGLGKSSYLTPLLILRLLQEKGIPVVFSSQAMYSIDKENLQSMLALFGIKLDVLEVGMHTQLTLKKLKLIYRNLLVCLDERRPLIMIPQSFYALKLMYQHALKMDGKTERVEYLSKICDFMKKNCRLICDESHLVFDANTTAIYGFDELIEESPVAYTLYIQLLYPLLGIEAEDMTARNLFLECQKMSGNEEENGSSWASKILLIQKALSEKMISQILPGLSGKERAAYCEFVYHPEHAAPPSFATLPKETKDQIGYLRFFLTTLLPPLTQMKLGRDHNPSPYPNQDFHTPCHKGVATTTQFLESLQTIVVTIKGVFESGLTKEQVIGHLSLLSLKASTYNRVNQIDAAQSLSKADVSFAKWAKNTPFEGRTLGSLDLENPEEKKALTTHFGHNKAMITDILQTTILPQIKFPKYQMELTPADLANMGKAFAFSATPGPLQTLPTHFQGTLYDHPFTSQVVSTMLQNKNLTQIYPTSLAAEDFFSYLKEKKSNTFRKSRALIDLGGAFAHLPNQKIASLWLKASELDGVLFFQKNQGLSINREEKICLLLKEGRVIPFEGSRLQEAMTKAALNYTTMKLGVFYDVSHTESADIPILGHLPSFNILFVPGSDDRFTYSAAVQAVMRIRDFLSSTKERKLIWVFPKGLPSKTSEELYREMIKNEAANVRSRILHAAAQEIVTVIRASLEAQLSPKTDAQEQIQLMKGHEKAFMSLRKTDPSITYCLKEENLAVDAILNAFALSYYNKCYGSSSIPKRMQHKIDKLIQRASSLVQTASSTALESPDREVEVETEVKQEKKAHRPKPDDPIRAAPIYGKVSIREEGFIKDTAHYLSTDLFGPKISSFYFESNQIKTAKFYDQELNEKKLKPIDFFIILFDKEGKVHIRAIVNESVNQYMQDLTETEELPFLGHRALVMTGDGHIVRRGMGFMKPTEQEEEQFFKSKEYQNLIIDRAFLEARLPKDLKATIRRIQEWGPSFRQFYNKMVEAHPQKEAIDTEAFKKIIDIALETSS